MIIVMIISIIIISSSSSSSSIISSVSVISIIISSSSIIMMTITISSPERQAQGDISSWLVDPCDELELQRLYISSCIMLLSSYCIIMF